MELTRISNFINEADCCKITTLSRITHYRMRRKGTFPELVALSPGRKAYRASEIDAWTKGQWKSTVPSRSDFVSR